MSLFDQKSSLLNQVSALKSLNNGFPELDFGSSFPSLNNKANATDFLLDLLKTVVGFEQIKEELIRFLTYNTATIEANIKKVLKRIMKSKFSCSIDALIPASLIDGSGVGFNVAVSQIDFFEILKVNPTSVAGQMIYGNIDQDLNKFLHGILQGNNGTWKSLLVVTFQQQGIVDGVLKSNVFNVKIDSSWTGKTVNSFINTFVDSIVLFTLPTLINNIFDTIFGTIAAFLNKSPQTIQAEVQLQTLVNKVVDLPDTIIDDSYFTFTADDLDYINQRIDERSNGRRVLKDCNYISSFVNFDDLYDTHVALQATSSLVEIKTTLDNRFSVLSAQATQNLDPANQKYGNLDFFEQLFKGILQALANIVFAPKIMFLFVTYFKIVSNTIGFIGFDDFLQQNTQFIIEIIRDALLPLLVEFLLKLVIKYVTQLILEDQVGRSLEMVKNQQLQILSLVGVPANIRDLIAKL
jgi:hypothetical protein